MALVHKQTHYCEILLSWGNELSPTHLFWILAKAKEVKAFGCMCVCVYPDVLKLLHGRLGVCVCLRVCVGGRVCVCVCVCVCTLMYWNSSTGDSECVSPGGGKGPSLDCFLVMSSRLFRMAARIRSSAPSGLYTP